MFTTSDTGETAMSFDQKIATLNGRGFTHHVFQDYGSERGHSMSFKDFASAKRHARKVDGIVYNAKGADVTFDGT